MRSLAVLSGLVLLAALLPVTAAAPADGAAEIARERYYDDTGRLVMETGDIRGRPDLSYVKHFLHAPEASPAKPDNPGNGNGKGGGGGGDGGSDPGTDCEADQYKLTGYHWTEPYSAVASAYASVFQAAGATWDDETSASILGSITAGKAGTAGELDGVNQLDFRHFGSGGTIAVTTTWYYTFSGEAVESDGEYNTYYVWATNGDPDAMDVQAIGTHEIGHTFGLSHPNGNPTKISCLTMYAYGSEGSTIERTLGDGDILGVRDVYGA